MQPINIKRNYCKDKLKRKGMEARLEKNARQLFFSKANTFHIDLDFNRFHLISSHLANIILYENNIKVENGSKFLTNKKQDQFFLQQCLHAFSLTVAPYF